MKKRFDIDVELIKSSGGAFEVELDGDLIYSKKSNGRFPEHGEVEAEVKKRVVA